MRLFTLCFLFSVVLLRAGTTDKNDPGISKGKDGTLVYEANKRGDKICDFSFAGYEAGLKELPKDIKVITTLKPLGAGKDDTAQIQTALDTVGKNALDNNGFRGVVKLTKGTFIVNGSLSIKSAGVILKGDGATLNCKGGNMRTVLILGSPDKMVTLKKHYQITDTYVPVGAKSLHLEKAAGLVKGTKILICKDVTEKWINSLGMNKLVRDGQKQTWIKVGATLDVERTIVKVANNEIFWDIPLCDSIDAAFFEKLEVVQITDTNRVQHIGVEGITLVTNISKTDIAADSMQAVELLSIDDSWVKDCTFTEFMTGIDCGSNSRRITLQDNHIARSAVIPGSAKPFDIRIQGSQILIRGGSSSSAKTVVFSIATMGSSSTFGPNAIINYKQETENLRIEPHMRWGATGLLIQNAVGGGGVCIINREAMGTGHGWTGANCVVWNSNCPVVVDSPPGYQNFVFGGKHPTGSGTFKPAQSFDLYETQLAERKKLSSGQ